LLTLRIHGQPSPKGSKRALGRRRNGSTILVESCRTLAAWEASIAAEARAAGADLLQGPIQIEALFLFARPASHLRRDGSLTPKAPRHHTSRPDLSKLQRGIEDPLSGVIYGDDSQIVAIVAQKRWCLPGEQPGAVITLAPYAVPG
jgi:Holliday junction resolvase RusA-like endonuclease